MKRTRKEEYHEIISQIPELEYHPTSPFIQVNNLVKNFKLGDTQIQAVDNITLNIHQHEYVVIVGESGAGKTTLLHLLGGLDKPSAGKVILSHIDLSHFDQETLATFRIFTVGIVFQNYNLISSLTSLENILFPMQLCDFTVEESLKRATELLESVGLSARADHLPFQLSAGEQQRVAIARALALNPPIILADEPTANLDKTNAEYIGRLFEELRQQGKTVVLISHDEKLIKHAHRKLEMAEGKIVKDEILQEIIFNDSIENFATNLDENSTVNSEKNSEEGM
ncbi:MAG: ABC transporter ATP-binding protein [Promethearchaeota archaeon]